MMHLFANRGLHRCVGPAEPTYEPDSTAYCNLFLGYKKAQFRARTRFPCYWLPRPRLRGLVLVSAEERACTEFPISNTSHV